MQSLPIEYYQFKKFAKEKNVSIEQLLGIISTYDKNRHRISNKYSYIRSAICRVSRNQILLAESNVEQLEDDLFGSTKQKRSGKAEIRLDEEIEKYLDYGE